MRPSPWCQQPDFKPVKSKAKLSCPALTCRLLARRWSAVCVGQTGGWLYLFYRHSQFVCVWAKNHKHTTTSTRQTGSKKAEQCWAGLGHSTSTYTSPLSSLTLPVRYGSGYLSFYLHALPRISHPCLLRILYLPSRKKRQRERYVAIDTFKPWDVRNPNRPLLL
jgi:hypothetical protein